MKPLIIRQATEADLKKIALFEFQNRHWFSQFLPTQALEKQTEVYFRCLLKGKLQRLQYLVFTSNKELIGRFNGQILDAKKPTLEVSYRIAQGFTNLGIAQYALKRILLVWASSGIEEVYAQVSDHNTASIKVLTSCGFEFEEIQKEAINLESIIHDCWTFRWRLQQ
jgi:ribosomal-protein-alanine N-acetyltransferase